MTDPYLVADAYLVGTTGVVAGIAKLLGKSDAQRYEKEHTALRAAFRDEYVSKNGRLASDAQTAYVLALQWDLLESSQIDLAVDRLVRLIRRNGFRIGTGFAGTPVILDMLAKHGQLAVAYRMLQERECPSWLYPITMGATTVWERWDSLLPNGDINVSPRRVFRALLLLIGKPGEMTSFNHYALGSVAQFMHSTIGGISPLAPGWKEVLVQPQPGGTVTSAKVYHISPYGRVACEWTLKGGKMEVKLEIPPNSTAKVVLPGQEAKTVQSGYHAFSVPFTADERWPPKAIPPGHRDYVPPDTFEP